MTIRLRFVPAALLAVVFACSDEDPNALRSRSGATPDEGASDPRLDFSNAPLRRLTRGEIRASLDALMPSFSVDDELVRALPEDAASPFDNDATTQSAGERLVRSMNDLAEDMAAKFVAGSAPREKVLGCTPQGPKDDACMTAFVERFGKRAFRRPLAKDEVAGYVSRASALPEASGDFNVAAGRIISSILQDVEFLYRIEVGQPSPSDPTRVVLGDHAIATRMAALLWGSVPDDDVLGIADSGSLQKAAGRRQAAEAMLKSPKARAHLSRFHAMWIGYETSLPRTSALSPSIQKKLRDESDALISRVILDEHKSWFDIWRSKETMIDDELAKYYGDVPLPNSSVPKWIDYGASKRRGLFGHGSLHNVANKFTDTSPTQRGKMVRERLLCQKIEKTPPDLMVNLDEPPKAGKCKNDGYRSVLQNPKCSGCHKAMDPIGFGLENYDLGGRYRTTEPSGAECPIDGKGSVIDSKSGATADFSGPSELVDVLLAQKDLESCMEKRLVQYTLGRPDTADDEVTLEALSQVFHANAERLDALLIEIVASASFAQKKLD